MEEDLPTFKTLISALHFIEKCLANDKQVELFKACLTSRASDFMRPRICDQLAKTNSIHGLRKLYLNREFPTDDGRFKLGGHASELGHIHIDFVRKETGWQLDAIWMCR